MIDEPNKNSVEIHTEILVKKKDRKHKLGKAAIESKEWRHHAGEWGIKE